MRAPSGDEFTEREDQENNMVSAGFTKSNLRLFKTFLRPLRMKFKTYITTSKTHTQKKKGKCRITKLLAK